MKHNKEEGKRLQKKIKIESKQEESSDIYMPEKDDDEIVQNQEKSMDTNKAKVNRGYKQCKNEKCSKILHIHTKICPDCKLEAQFNIPDKKSKDSMNEFMKLIKKIKELDVQKQKIPKKYLHSIFVFKKNLLQDDSYNFDATLVNPYFFNLQSRIYSDCLKNKELVQRSDDEKQFLKLLNGKTKEMKIYYNNKMEKILSPLGQVGVDIGDKRLSLFNLGFPILSVQFAPRQFKEHCELYTHYLAVSLQTNYYNYNNIPQAQQQTQRLLSRDLNIALTVQQFALEQFHIMGIPFEGNGLIAIISIDQTKEYKINYLLSSKYGCITKMKWCPKYSDSDQEIGLLGVVTAQGHFNIYSIPINKQTSSSFPPIYQKNPLIKINFQESLGIKDCLINCFDWVLSKECDTIALGDQYGRFFIIKIGTDYPDDYLLLNYISNLHLNEITDIQSYLHNDSQCLLIATSSYDGTVKVLEPLKSNNPLFDINLSSKGVQQVRWDNGGKYIQVLRDDPTSRALLISFFGVEKAGVRDQDKISNIGYTLSDHYEQRFLGSLCGQEQTINFCTNFNHPYTYFSNDQGQIYQCGNDTIRKLAVKKDKKQQEVGTLISHIITENNIVTILNTEERTNMNMDIERTEQERKYKLDQKIDKSSFKEIHVTSSTIGDIKKNEDPSYLVYSNLSGLLVIQQLF